MIANSLRDWQGYSFPIDPHPSQPSHDFMCEHLLALSQEKWILCSKFAFAWASWAALAPRLLCVVPPTSSTCQPVIFSFRRHKFKCRVLATFGVWLYQSWQMRWDFKVAWVKNVAWDTVYKNHQIHITSFSHDNNNWEADEKKKKKVGVRHKRGDKFRPAVTAKWESHLKGSNTQLAFFCVCR